MKTSMKKTGKFKAAFAMALGLSTLFTGEAEAKSKPAPAPTVKKSFCQPDEIRNRLRIDAAFDLETGLPIYGDPHTRFYQASMTKRIVEYVVLKAVRDGNAKWNDMIELPSVHLRNANNVEQNSDAIPFEYKRISLRDGFIAGNRGSSNRFMQGVMAHLTGSEEKGVEMLNRVYQELGISDEAMAATVTGFPTTAMRYEIPGRPLNHFITPYAHALIVWKINHDFADEIKELYIARPRVTAFNAAGAHQFDVKITSGLLPNEYLDRGHRTKMINLKTGTTCGTGSAADYVVNVQFDINGQTINRDIIYITAGHASGGGRDAHARQFLINLPEQVRQNLWRASTNDRNDFAERVASVSNPKELENISLTYRGNDGSPPSHPDLPYSTLFAARVEDTQGINICHDISGLTRALC